ncbi:MAG: AraC-like DNA-binding protein [Glaciecola sp.]|jgi:AraC-like DNA-binding protein|uniref:helix-turn-helix domain-containing protein n=1 Tax=Congregibacter sp. TaxID=2744308 RepID=UPI0039E36136
MNAQERFVRSYIEAWNDHDPSGVASHLCAGGLYCDIPSQTQLGGKALLSHLVDYFSNDHYRYGILGDVLVNENTMAFQYEVIPVDSPPEIQGWSGAEFVELAGDTAHRINDYYRVPGAQSRRAGLTDQGRRYAKSGLGNEAMETLLGALKKVMGQDKIYLDPELSLPYLADHLGCSVNHLSQAINAGHAMSFFDYINQFRVTEAAHMLRQKDCQFPAILDVALSVGFNSTSTFYTAFKKATGQTPAKYRRTQ